MFGHRYFGARYFGPRYFGPAVGGVTPTPTPTPPPSSDGGGVGSPVRRRTAYIDGFRKLKRDRKKRELEELEELRQELLSRAAQMKELAAEDPHAELIQAAERSFALAELIGATPKVADKKAVADLIKTVERQLQEDEEIVVFLHLL